MIALVFLASFPVALVCGVLSWLLLRDRRYRQAALLFVPTTFPLLLALGFTGYDNRWHSVDMHCPVSAPEVVGTWRGRGGEVTFRADGSALTNDGLRWQWKEREDSSSRFTMSSVDARSPARCWVALCRRGAVFLLPVDCDPFADPDAWNIGQAYDRVR